ncbi:hypothetical protein MLD38_030876 [Melastoma candidum]|uniref:Uncharacterized protein n=1 Tax=Melastoma candidum TaxID=119954 RepID=A0ACB9MQ32_9MYRT|nr:hypothetical protein MLD38_030876 [Melastoma candidum]
MRHSANVILAHEDQPPTHFISLHSLPSDHTVPVFNPPYKFPTCSRCQSGRRLQKLWFHPPVDLFDRVPPMYLVEMKMPPVLYQSIACFNKIAWIMRVLFSSGEFLKEACLLNLLEGLHSLLVNSPSCFCSDPHFSGSRQEEIPLHASFCRRLRFQIFPCHSPKTDNSLLEILPELTMLLTMLSLRFCIKSQDGIFLFEEWFFHSGVAMNRLEFTESSFDFVASAFKLQDMLPRSELFPRLPK